MLVEDSAILYNRYRKARDEQLAMDDRYIVLNMCECTATYGVNPNIKLVESV